MPQSLFPLSVPLQYAAPRKFYTWRPHARAPNRRMRPALRLAAPRREARVSPAAPARRTGMSPTTRPLILIPSLVCSAASPPPRALPSLAFPLRALRLCVRPFFSASSACSAVKIRRPKPDSHQHRNPWRYQKRGIPRAATPKTPMPFPQPPPEIGFGTTPIVFVPSCLSAFVPSSIKGASHVQLHSL